MEQKTTLKTGNTSTAQEDLLTIAQQELLFPSPLNQSQQLAGWTQPNFNLKLPTTPNNQTRSRFVSLSKLQSGKSSREHSQDDETRSDLKLKLHEYLNNTNHGTEEPAITIQIHSPKEPSLVQEPAKEDFLRGQKVKSFARRTKVMKPFYSKLNQRNTERHSLTTRMGKRSEEKPQKQRKFRVTTKRANGATIVCYPIQVDFPFDAEEKKLSTRLQSYLKNRVSFH